jgi:hypothetical protein
MSLGSAAEELKSFIEFDLELLRSSPPLKKLGPVCDELSLHYQALGGASILLGGDTDAFHHALARSASIRVHYLSRCAVTPDFRSPHRAAGNAAAFFDAVACRHEDLTRQIVSLSPSEWWEGEEYEDDFCFAYFFHRVATGTQPSHSDLAEIIEQFSKVLGGEENGKLKICQALAANDQGGFDEALDMLLDDYEAFLEEEKQRFSPNDRIVYRIKSRIYTEGLAILNIAEQLGLRTQADYRYCPPLCRATMRSPFPPPLALQGS